MLKAPQITYLDYKSNGENYDPSFAKVFSTIFSHHFIVISCFCYCRCGGTPGLPFIAYVPREDRKSRYASHQEWGLIMGTSESNLEWSWPLAVVLES